MGLFKRNNHIVEHLTRIEADLLLIIQELKQLNAVAGQWNVQEIRPGDEIPPATVRTLSYEQMAELEEIRTGATGVAMKSWAYVSE
jgi:hypothetical protein